jgi:putative transposase
VAAQSRKTQEWFLCVECGFSAHANFVGSVNIREAGLALLACGEIVRSGDSRKQEPTEATEVQQCA